MADSPAIENVSNISERIIQRLRETTTVERVFGDPIERDGATLVPAASLRSGGGGGGGGGGDERGSGSGAGSGFGATARPVGAYVISGGTVRWKPAVDPVRLFVAGTLTAIAYFFFDWLRVRATVKGARS